MSNSQDVMVTPTQASTTAATDAVPEPVDLKNFFSTRDVIFSSLSLYPHPEELGKLFRQVFGLKEDFVTSGIDISDEEYRKLQNYVAKKTCNSSISQLKKEKEYPEVFLLTHPNIKGLGRLRVSLDSILHFTEVKDNGWVNGEIMDFFRWCKFNEWSVLQNAKI